ncbi:MAG: hypothetical protein KHW93_06570 [Butyricicoccus pullicaecorum]|nr:hypothetical protein [Butyricicoccus pullicaecorum]
MKKLIRYVLCGVLTGAMVAVSGLYYRYQNPPEVTFCWPDALETMDGESTSQIFHMIHAAEIASSFKLDLNAYQMAEDGSHEDIAPHFVLLRQYPDLADSMYVPVILVSKEDADRLAILIQDKNIINYCIELEKDDAEQYGYRVTNMRRAFGRRVSAVFKGEYVG